MNDLSPDPAQEVEATLVDEIVEAPDPHTLGIELPDNQEEATNLLLSHLHTARQEADSYLDELKRVAAEFDNYRKRTTREAGVMLDRATEKVIAGMLPILDSFDAALGTDPTTEGEQQIFSGMVNTREQLLKALEADGLAVVPTVGEPFDPEVHEAVGSPSGVGLLTVAEELRRGYTLNGRLLRPALVALELG